MISHHLHSTTLLPDLSVVRVTAVPVDVLHVNVQESIRHLSPSRFQVQLADTVTYQGTRYSKGMIVAYGSPAGFPDFAVILEIALIGCILLREHRYPGMMNTIVNTIIWRRQTT